VNDRPVAVAVPSPPQSSPTPGWPTRSEWTAALDSASRLAIDYLSELPEARVSQHASPEQMAPRFDEPLPEFGCLPEEAVQEWFSRAEPGIVRTPGPRYFGFVTGGATPAALAGDWLASAIDQNAAMWLMSPAAAQTELAAIRWLLELFALPPAWSGALTSGATMSNLCGLAAARQWASWRLGFDAAQDGLGGRAPMAVIGSSETHQSAIKALGTLGLGRGSLITVPAREGIIDLDAFSLALDAISGPVIAIANAGEVNTGAFDPIRAMAERCAEHAAGAWLHVDAAFGLYAQLSVEHRHLLEGIELADSVASDAHKWLNVPYDCGFVFVRDAQPLRGAFAGTAAYLNSSGGTPLWNAFEHLPEFSRRFRGLSVWCALRSAGHAGYQEIVNRSIANARQFADWVDQHPELELLAPATLNIVCFRFLDPSHTGANIDDLNARALELLQRGGLAYGTATRWRGASAIRAAFDNWATGPEDIAALEQAITNVIALIKEPQ
jgi:glutamate/tyrosine decarboxylase-like PLP-dependent enzyme